MSVISSHVTSPLRSFFGQCRFEILFCTRMPVTVCWVHRLSCGAQKLTEILKQIFQNLNSLSAALCSGDRNTPTATGASVVPSRLLALCLEFMCE